LFHTVAQTNYCLLAGPPFTHLSQPRYAHFIGGSSPKTSPSHYLSALNDLAQRYQLELKYTTASDYDIADELEPLKNSTVIPLVINTQGWIKGMGADLLRSIEELFGPTHIVEFQLPQTPSSLDVVHDRPIPIVESIAHNICDTSRHTITLLPIFSVSRPPRFSAADLRSLAFASYFYGRFPTSSSSNGDSNGFIIHWDTSLSLRSVAPIVIDTRSALESIVIVAPAGDDVVPEELPRALICGVVGLVAPDSPSTPPGITYIQGALPPAPQVSRCVGLGFIRGASNTQLHLLTPAPVHLLRLCRTIVLGELFMPVWAFLELDGNNAEESGIPFLQWGRSIAENAGGERRRIRRNIMRRGRS
jgi:polynucleotide 5'-hydroxyl-kinase GRC3/NOL9